MSLQFTGTNQSNSTLLAYDGSTQQVNLYSSFGSVNSAQNGQLPGFNGERPDPFTGATHLGNGYRAYNPILMRFTSPDSESPFGVGGINPYAYCENDPVNFSDPSGHGIFKLFVRGLTFVFKHLFEEATAKALAKDVAATTKFALIYGTRIASSMTNSASYMIAKENPQAAAKLQKASFAFGVINAASTLYSSYHGIFKNVKTLIEREGVQPVKRVVDKAITQFDEFGNNETELRLSGVTEGESSDTIDDIFEDIVEAVLDIEEPVSENEVLTNKRPNTTKTVYQIVSATLSLTSTALNIGSESIRETDPKKAEKLSLASSAFGLGNIVMDFGQTVHSVKDKGRKLRIFWSKFTNTLELGGYNMSYPVAILPPDTTLPKG